MKRVDTVVSDGGVDMADVCRIHFLLLEPGVEWGWKWGWGGGGGRGRMNVIIQEIRRR